MPTSQPLLNALCDGELATSPGEYSTVVQLWLLENMPTGLQCEGHQRVLG